MYTLPPPLITFALPPRYQVDAVYSLAFRMLAVLQEELTQLGIANFVGGSVLLGWLRNGTMLPWEDDLQVIAQGNGGMDDAGRSVPKNQEVTLVVEPIPNPDARSQRCKA